MISKSDLLSDFHIDSSVDSNEFNDDIDLSKFMDFNNDYNAIFEIMDQIYSDDDIESTEACDSIIIEDSTPILQTVNSGDSDIDQYLNTTYECDSIDPSLLSNNISPVDSNEFIEIPIFEEPNYILEPIEEIVVPRTFEKSYPFIEESGIDSDISNDIEQLQIKSNSPQNLNGLKTIRIPNNYNQHTEFPNDGTYTYELHKRAYQNPYEPIIVRKDLTDPHAKNFGLCPYCEDFKFLSLTSSAYVHHLTICHGIFSDGTLVKEPEVCVEEVVRNGDCELVEFFKCPYDCHLHKIKMVRFNKFKNGSRYKVYLRHVKEFHNCGKRNR